MYLFAYTCFSAKLSITMNFEPKYGFCNVMTGIILFTSKLTILLVRSGRDGGGGGGSGCSVSVGVDDDGLLEDTRETDDPANSFI